MKGSPRRRINPSETVENKLEVLTTNILCAIVSLIIPTEKVGIKEVRVLILSTKGRYGVRAAFDLALHYGEGPIPLKSIAERQNISDPYLEQLIAVLRKDGLVNSVRGAQGGYMLSRRPSQISVGEIIRSLEGPMAPAECVLDDQDKECIKADYCVTRVLWEKIRDSINNVINSVSLQDMIEDYKRMEKDYSKEEGDIYCDKKSLC